MNTNNIKNYAPKARRDFIAAMTKQAARYGITTKGIEALEQKGDVALIGGRPFPATVIRPRAALVKRVEQLGFDQAMEQAAYSWFNRLCAIRYMELKDYLEHGRRVLSAVDGRGAIPQILEDCLDIDLPGLDKQRITELKLDGNKDEELYRELLLAQCHALHQAMPFLFETVDDATELLLPDNLTKTDSLIRELVDAIPEEDWANIEVIGWLYQFYISEKKDQVIGKVIKSEDIPAATQLFTPNWIVKYMIQNSLGAQWLATYPESPLKAQMEYYIEPVEQTNEVRAQLSAITPESLNPEELTLIDPASGSGHILVEAYDLFKAIYLERGYRQRDVAQLILEKNLFGLDIDGRAAQLTGFALTMKGRADDRRLFERGVKLNVVALVDSGDFDAEAVINGVNLGLYGLQAGDITELKRLFEQATTFGSLIQVPEELAAKLTALKQLSEATSQDLFVSEALKIMWPLVQQAELLGAQYDAVVANPPYMGRRNGMNGDLKSFVNRTYSHCKADIYAAFMQRGFDFSRGAGWNAMVTMQSWMFLSSYQGIRESVLREHTIHAMAHLGARAFPSISGEVVQVTVTAMRWSHIRGFRPIIARLVEGDSESKRQILLAGGNEYSAMTQDEYLGVPGSPIAYWIPKRLAQVLSEGASLDIQSDQRQGLATGDDESFIRLWHEIPTDDVNWGATSMPCDKPKWYPFLKGGAFRKWYGNNEHVILFDSQAYEALGQQGNSLPSRQFYLRESLVWSDITSRSFAARYNPSGKVFGTGALSAFPKSKERLSEVLGYLNSVVHDTVMAVLSSGIHYSVGYVDKSPFIHNPTISGDVERIVGTAVAATRADWDAFEISWDFQCLPILTVTSDSEPTLESSYTAWIAQNRSTIAEMKRLEEENNRLFINAYDLGEELTPDVPIEQITLTINPAYRYGGKMTEEELWARFRENSMQELVSYVVGCMMGRYSLDEPGLIYAHSGNHGFDHSRYTSFPADPDGILPLSDREWFVDDAANRLIEFISVAWDKTHLETNLRFLADNLSPKKAESSRDTLRRYLCDNFFKDHLKTYRNRPIYWQFSSGKHKAFQCLVYLHRYNEGTLARMRTEYVIPLSAKLNSYAAKLEKDIDASNSTVEKKALEKQLTTLHNQQAELATFDEKLRQHADLRITLDLDDGVKENYGKFGDLLAEVKTVTGGSVSD